MRSKAPTFTETARRAQIANCAIEAIAELGYSQASVRRIADRAGVAMSVVMYHFGNKDDLVAAIVSECYRTLIEAMLPKVAAELSAAGKLAAHIRAHMRYLKTHRSHQVAITEIANNFRGQDGKRLADLDIDPEHFEALAKVDLEVILGFGVASGEFSDMSVDHMALAVRSAIGGALMRSTSDPGFDVTAYGEDLVSLFLGAITPAGRP